MLNSKVSKAVRLAFAFGAASTAVFSANTIAATNDEVERIEVTGSSIKRTDLEGALPIDVISAADIAKTGVTTVADLVATLPSMQGFTTAGESVGGGGGGTQSASLRNLGSQYTLVLLNGRRMPASDSGGSVNVNNIPLAAVKRVEILKDGASALYGSDAIAGVINFILKDDVQETTISARYDKPQDTSSSTFSITTGFGDLSSDGFNILASLSYDEQDSLRSVDRDYAKTGFLNFEHGGEQYLAAAGSVNAIPANAYAVYNTRDKDNNFVYQTDEDTGEFILDDNGNKRHVTATQSFNPYAKNNGGTCHETSAPSGTACQFDFTSTLQIQPETERTALFLSGIAEVNDTTEAYSSFSYTDFALVARIAPYPTDVFTLPTESDIVQTNVIPHLEDKVLNDLVRVDARWRTLPGGNRTTEFNTVSHHFVAGLRGEINEWAYDVAVTSGETERKETRITGFPLEKEFLALARSGEIDIFDAPENISDEQSKMVADTMFSGLWQTTDTSMLSFEGKLSGALADIDAGTVYLGVGFDYRQSGYSLTNGEGQNAEIVLFEAAGTEFDLEREGYGAFAELIVPVLENLEVSGSIRYDNIGGITDSLRTGNQDVSDDVNDTTYKISASYRPTDELLVRASYGTGFKAPTMRQIAAPRLEFGVSSGAYDCNELLGATNHPLKQYCNPEKIQYDMYREGNVGLSPEESEQYSVGFVWAGDSGTSFGIDYWNIEMTNEVRRLEPNQIWFDSATYADRFVTKIDRGTGDREIAIVRSAQNVGKSNTSGIDWQFDLTNEFSFGTLKTSLQGTYLLENRSLKVGTTDEWNTSLGQVGEDEQVAFRNIITVNNTLTHGDFTHSLNIRTRSGYRDAAVGTAFRVSLADDVSEVVDGDLIQKYVPVYTLFDYRLGYAYGDNANLTFGVKNLFDRNPPMSFNGDAGHQVGYDSRYADAYGRTLYIQADYTF
ncbi:iron complex outermembrane recepter protein [Pseudoalteromonas citrea]|uniref:Iron complex outermembrane recepter protein n=2 Tax=Pseudoalteromonas citrea TaxID=43655 RepID=A0AAD4AM93_9GAMM|nr:TonB-dependent receptor [Pseudoalteromonas citrea]KAF7775327.1 iron complex outermembrane recepter protein [Pseudoalteromonas citrea]